MDYALYISTPANTTEADPKITSLRLSKGRLSGGFLYFPRGPSGVLHFIARIGVHQIVPFNVGHSYRLNQALIPLDLNIDFFQPPYIIDCVTWNDSTTHSHALTVGFFLDPYKKPRIRKGIVQSLYDATLGYKKGSDRKI